MPHRTGPSSRALVHPNREVLRALRDRYMRQLEARSYDEVRNKFLEELQSKWSPDSRARSSSSLQRERGAGIWNKAFASASKGKMLRSSIILLAEFFDVEPEELIVEEEEAPRPPRPPRDSFQPPRGSRSVPTLSIGTISSDGGVHIQGTVSQSVVICGSIFGSIEIEPGPGESREAEEGC